MNEAEQLDAFQKGAAQRYAELGVKPEDAVRLFNEHLEKLATAYPTPTEAPTQAPTVIEKPMGRSVPQPVAITHPDKTTTEQVKR